MHRLLLFLIAVSFSIAPVAAYELEHDAKRQTTVKKNERPNIILVMADDQGWGDVGYYGHPHLKTPHFDKMAAENLRMDRFYAAAPVCSPTRASVLTGRHPNRMGVFKWGYPIRPQEQTLPEILKANGYTTAHFGKWHLGSVRKGSPAHPGNNGFDEWQSAPNFYENDPVFSHQGKAVQYQGESSVVTMKLAIDWMQNAVKKEQPFFAVVWFGSPHGPHIASKELKKLYPDLPANQQNFLGEVSGMDQAMGDLQSALTAMKIRENTLLWYTSDNGALPRVGSTGGFRGNKGKVYEGGLLVPSIIQWPAKIDAHRKTEFRGNSCDILPTVLEAAGIKSEPVHPLDGISLMSLIQGKKKMSPRSMGFWDYSTRGKSVPATKMMKELFAAQSAGNNLKPGAASMKAAELPEPAFGKTSFPGHAAWISGDWKLHRIEGNKGNVRFELYDLKSDRKEAKNVIKENAEVVVRLKKELASWQASVVDSLNGKDYRKEPPE